MTQPQRSKAPRNDRTMRARQLLASDPAFDDEERTLPGVEPPTPIRAQLPSAPEQAGRILFQPLPLLPPHTPTRGAGHPPPVSPHRALPVHTLTSR